MATRTPPSTLDNHNSDIQPPLLASYSGSNLNAPFTPRSTTFPDDNDSDPDFDVFEPTPMHSPGGPRYEELPPSYDEAQQQALQDARAGIPPLDPNNLEVHRMVLSNDSPPSSHLSLQQSRSSSSILVDPNAYEFEPENRRNANGLGMTVPVQQVARSEQIPVAHMKTGNAPSIASSESVPPNPASILLHRALAFTRHEPAADARYAPRLTRSVAIPQTTPIIPARQEHHRGRQGCGRKGAGRREHGRRHHQHHNVPGQWPDAMSTDTLQTETGITEEPVKFLRGYAKVLHAHDIRPAEFAEFLDGLNALCSATNTTPRDLVSPETTNNGTLALVQSYIDATNETFFAPRGLKVSLKPLSALIDTLSIPEDRGQRAGAIASAIDGQSTPDQRAQALYPWVEPLDINVPAPSTQTILTQEMSDRLRRHTQPPTSSTSIPEEVPKSNNMEKADIGNLDTDPPHSVPGSHPGFGPNGVPPFPQLNFGVPGAWGTWNSDIQNSHFPPGPQFPPFHGYRGRGWGPGPFAHQSSSHRGGPWARGRGWGPGSRCGPGVSGGPPANNSWAAWGEGIGKWGEGFGKRMEAWGEQFGKRAEQWGQNLERQGESYGRAAEQWGENVERRAEAWGESVEAKFSGKPTQNRQVPGESSGQVGVGVGVTATSPPPVTAPLGPETFSREQQTGILREEFHIETKEEKRARKMQSKEEDVDDDDDDDDDASSISSISSASSSSSSSSSSQPDTSALFLSRVHSINAAATASRSKGKKSPSEIDLERALAIEKASAQKELLDLKIEHKRVKRAFRKEWREKKREMKKKHWATRREWKKDKGAEGKKGVVGLGKRERREIRKRQIEEVRELKKEYIRAREEMRREMRDVRGMKREKSERVVGGNVNGGEGVWVVVENLGS